MYLGNKLFDKVLELVDWLQNNKKQFFFLSNNSSQSSSEYIVKLKKHGLDITSDNIILSQHPTIAYLKEEKYKKVFLMGNQSLKEEFRQEGFEIVEVNPDILVLAFDQELTYDRLVKATYLLLADIPYIATHPDDRCPTEEGYIPDAGGIAALLYKAAERMPRVFGKPNKDMLLFKLNQLKISPEDAVMFGDRLYTDIEMGLNAGVTTCCVLSGETTLKMIEESDSKPDLIINGIWDFFNAIK